MKATTAEVDKVTKAKYGAATVTAEVSAEAAVKFVTAPTAKSGDKSFTVSGSTDVGGYVYCAATKVASRRFRMLANDTNATTNATTPAAATEADSMTSASTKQKYNVMRATTTTKALTFSLKFDVAEGATHKWMCEATSLNPSNPLFRSGITKGDGSANKAAVVVVGDSALWSSLFAAIIMIAAVFFY